MFGITTLYSFSQFLFSVTDSILDMVIDTRLKKKKKKHHKLSFGSNNSESLKVTLDSTLKTLKLGVRTLK